MRSGAGRQANSKAACTSSTPKVWVTYAGKQLGMLAGELVGGGQHPPTLQCHTGFQRQVVAQHRPHADRVAVVVCDTEIEDRPTECRRFDRVAECRDLMADGLDDDVRPIVAFQLAHPPVAGGPDDRVDAELLGDGVAVDGVDSGDATGTRSLCRIGEQQPDRPLPDHGDVQTLELRKLLERIQHTGQWL